MPAPLPVEIVPLSPHVIVVGPKPGRDIPANCVDLAYSHRRRVYIRSVHEFKAEARIILPPGLICAVQLHPVMTELGCFQAPSRSDLIQHGDEREMSVFMTGRPPVLGSDRVFLQFRVDPGVPCLRLVIHYQPAIDWKLPQGDAQIAEAKKNLTDKLLSRKDYRTKQRWTARSILPLILPDIEPPKP